MSVWGAFLERRRAGRSMAPRGSPLKDDLPASPDGKTLPRTAGAFFRIHRREGNTRVALLASFRTSLKPTSGRRGLLSRCVLAWVVACLGATSCAHTVTLRTKPAKAAVYQLDAQGKRGPKLGDTPLVLDALPAGDVVHMQVELAGYLPRDVIVAPSGGRAIEVELTLPEIDASTSKTLLIGAGSGAVNATVSDLLELQTEMLYPNNDKRVEELIRQRAAKYADLSVYHTLVGAWYFNKRDARRARESFRRALELDPKNEEASRMLGTLSKGRK